MNKQEAIEKIKNIDTLNINDIFAGQSVDMVIKNQVIDLISQIDEPQKVIIPKFVAEWLEDCKSSYRDLQTVLSRLDDDREVGDWAYDEDGEFIPEKAEIFARAWLDGYEIEKEKLYTVEIPDPNSYCDYRYLSRSDNGICLDASNDTKWRNKKKNQFTESEIKQDFEWAFQFAKPVEVE